MTAPSLLETIDLGVLDLYRHAPGPCGTARLVQLGIPAQDAFVRLHA